MFRGRVTREVRMALQSMFGRLTPVAVFAVIGFTVLLTMNVNTLTEWLDALFPPSWRVGVFMGFLAFAAVIAWLSGRPVGRYRVTAAAYPAKVPGLVVFLSWPGGPLAPIPELDAAGIERGAMLASTPSPIEHLVRGHPYSSWRMPLEGIRYHALCLKHLVVIASADSDSSREDGSYRCAQRFGQLLELFADLSPLSIKILDNEGIPYEDLEALDDAVSRAVDYLKSQGLKRREIVIDITSGKAMCSAAGAIRSLDEDLSFQYVSTTDRRLRGVDVVSNVEEG